MPLNHTLATLEPRVRAAVARTVPAQLRADEDDIVQEALLRVQRALERDPTTPMSQRYLYRAAHSAMVDRIRHRRASRLDPTHTPPDLPDPRPDPESSAVQQQIGQAIRDCVEEAVTASRREALTLWLLGHTVPDAARLLHVETKKAENLVYRGMAELRQCLHAKGYTP